MIISRRLINLAGTLLVAITLIAGTLLMALPVYLESADINSEEAGVAASNQLLVTQIDALRAKEAEMPQIQQDLDSLHEQLPGIPQLDDVSQLVLAAAKEADTDVLSIEFGDLTGFLPRADRDVIDSLPRTATDVRTAAEAAAESSDASAAGDAEASSDDPAPDPSGATLPTTGQIQIPVTISASAPTNAAAMRFLDELRTGPRLLQIDTITGTTDPAVDDDSEDTIGLIVTGLVFSQLNR